MELRASAGAPPQLTADGTQESRMDAYLRSLGLYRKKIAKDGSCLFRAVAEQVLHCQELHTQVRAACVDYLRQNRSHYELFVEGDFQSYLENLQDPQSWVGQVEISALALLYKHDFIIYQEAGQPPVNITENGFPDKVQLCFLNGNHYDSVYPQSFEKSAAVCQSILYELLYERVCSVDRSVLAPCVKGGRGREKLDTEECKSSEESDLGEDEFWCSDAKEKTSNVINSRQPQKGRGRGHPRGGGREFLSPKVQKSLNPALYRNVEYDVWLRSKRFQQQQDFCMAAGMQYTVGDKCKVQLRGSNRFYNAYVQDVSPDNGPITVFIEELGRQQTVPLLNLRLPSEEPQSWQTVSEKSKRHPPLNSNEHTASEWEIRGGRKSSKSVSNSAPSSRVLKQHSWPPQNAADDQSAGRNVKSRRSDQHSSPVCLVPDEDNENAILEQLQKDEHNFPSLGASAQMASAGEVIKRGGEKKSSRKKEQKEHLSETEVPQKPVQRQKSNLDEKQGVRVPEEPEQRSSPPIKEKSNPVSPSPAVITSLPLKTSPAPSQTDSATAPVQDRSAPEAIKMIPVQPPTGPAQSSDTNQSTSGPSLSASVATAVSVSTPASIQSAPTSKPTQTPTESAAALAIPGPNLSASQPTQAPSQNTPVTFPAPTHIIPVIPPTPVQVPAPVSSQTTVPPSVPVTSAPVENTLTIETSPVTSVSASPVIPTSAIPVSVSASTPAQVTDPKLETLDVPSAIHPPDRGSAQPSVQPTVDLNTAVMPTPPANVPPTSISPSSSLNPAPTPIIPQSSLNPSEPESSAIPVSDIAPASVSGHLSQTPQPAYPLIQWSQLLQDPLYPGFPQNEKGELIQTPTSFSLSQKGEDLPQDISILRFFFNLGVKAYSQQMLPPMLYLTPLCHAYQHFRGLSSSPLSNPSVTSWQSENPTQNLSSTSETSLDSHRHSHTPIAPVAVSSGPVGPIGVRGYIDHPPSIPMQVPSRPGVQWSSSPRPGTYAGTYPVPSSAPPVQFSAPPCPPPGGQMYPPTSIGFHHMPLSPVNPLEALGHAPHSRMDVLPFYPPVVERGQGNGQRAMTPQFGSLQKTTCFPGGQTHLIGGDFKPVDIPVSMTTHEPPFSGACTVVHPYPVGPIQGDIPGLTPLGNGNVGGQGEVFINSLPARPTVEEAAQFTHLYSPDDKCSFEDMELTNVDLRTGQSFYSQSYRGGGRHGQDDRGGYRGRSHRGRKDYAGRGRPDDQSSYNRGYYGKRGAGSRVGSQSAFQ